MAHEAGMLAEQAGMLAQEAGMVTAKVCSLPLGCPFCPHASLDGIYQKRVFANVRSMN